MERVSKMDCLICKRFVRTGLPVEVHHVAEGSSKRSDFATVPLCGDFNDGGHHRGSAGLHGMGTKAFCALYRPPFENEYGLLVWLQEDMA
jgi:hypothetical protein